MKSKEINLRRKYLLKNHIQTWKLAFQLVESTNKILVQFSMKISIRKTKQIFNELKNYTNLHKGVNEYILKRMKSISKSIYIKNIKQKIFKGLKFNIVESQELKKFLYLHSTKRNAEIKEKF